MDLDELYRVLRGSHIRARSIVDTIRDPLLVLDSDLCVISANPAFYRTFATHSEETVGLPFTDLGHGQWNIAELQALLSNVIPKSASVFDYEVRADFPVMGCRTMLISAQRVEHPDSRQRILLLSIVDATARRERENDQDMLIGEYDQRIRNMLSVMRALARQTRTQGQSAEAYRDALLQRFDALARAQEISTRGDARQLADLTARIMEPYLNGTSRVRILGGPPIALKATETVSLGMILHELSTNALKHGALSTSGGEVTIAWTSGQDDEGTSVVQLGWQERNGPAATPPSAPGFGTSLIAYSVRQELGGTARLDYGPDGLTAELTFPRV
ncbi:PAS domain-containing protein [Paracoccus liaowanqingii]|uniref:histidine kinase n=1 Tax=Paracoccus liaowanqingii TaxID=2560053 RepID=A0A4Z1BW79_9RHOB|nr:HWE histidine kinase domain-containing protein [Paracoccus liaowanqingii]TGN47720.1 PAS domain-containing protein [Paracoccus liaowanqingii]